MTAAQCHAARALIDMSHAEFPGAAVVPIAAIVDFETGAATPRPSDLAALERAGVGFIDGDRPGVRMRKGAN
jgi:hypothetical protein